MKAVSEKKPYGVNVSWPTEQLEKAGEILFGSREISFTGKVSCTSCHQPDNAFQDGMERAHVASLILPRNTPTILNVNRYTSFFWDGRAATLDEQIDGPLFARVELRSSVQLQEKFIRSDRRLADLARSIPVGDTALVRATVIASLRSYMLSMATTETRFSRYADGTGTLTESELRGEKIFQGKGGCGGCHAAPDFTDNKYHDNNLYRRKILFESIPDRDGDETFRLAVDLGRGNIVSGKDGLHRFRTPSLVNVALTEPYMHDGRFHSLKEVVDFYDRGGDIPESTYRPLGLTPQEKSDLVAFLKTLSDVRFDRPAVAAK